LTLWQNSHKKSFGRKTLFNKNYKSLKLFLSA
jgi:hypothetical protein